VSQPDILVIKDFAGKGEVKDQSQLWSYQVKDLFHRLGQLTARAPAPSYTVITKNDHAYQSFEHTHQRFRHGFPTVKVTAAESFRKSAAVRRSAAPPYHAIIIGHMLMAPLVFRTPPHGSRGGQLAQRCSITGRHSSLYRPFR